VTERETIEKCARAILRYLKQNEEQWEQSQNKDFAEKRLPERTWAPAINVRQRGEGHQKKRGILANSSRRFPPPWSVEKLPECFIVRDGQ
jgi:hypothetical protein